jgi:hypothetical protein
MEQTAVEWFAERIQSDKIFNFETVLSKAKEMEKEQIRIAYMEGAFEKMRHLEGKEFMMPTEYYNETFKTK